MSGGGDSTRAILFALGANLAIAVSKGAAAFFTGSGAMLAETVHSFADCGNQLLLLLGMRQARRPADVEHPLGYGRAIYFWSFLVALMLFSVGGVYSLYEGVHKLQHPQPLENWWWAVGVLAFAVAAESTSMRACLQEVKKVRGERSIWQWFRHSREAELVVIFGEDLAALVGLVLALLAVLASVATGNPLWDALGTVAIGALLVVVAVLVGTQVKSMLLGQSIEPEEQRRLLGWLRARPEIESVIHLIAMQFGTEAVVSVHAAMREKSDVRRLLDDINRVEAAMKAEFPSVRWSFFEPDFPKSAE